MMPVDLMIASFVLRHKLPTRAPEALTSLLSDFLIADMSIARACEVSRIGSLALLCLVWSRRRRGFKTTLANLLTTSRSYYRWEFSQALVQAVKKADLSMVQWLLNHFSRCPVSEQVVREAAKGGHLWVLQFLEADKSHSGIRWTENGKAQSLTDAANAGHWELMKWLHERSSTEETRYNNFELFEIAVAQNNLERVKWLIANDFLLATIRTEDCPRDKWSTHVEILRYLLDREIGDSASIVDISLSQAVRLDDLNTTRWLLERNEEFYEDDVFDSLLYNACEHGSLRMVQELLEKVDCLGQGEGPSDAMFAAAKYGNLHIVKWLWENYSRDPTATLFMHHDLTVTDVAAENGNLSVLQFLDRINAEPEDQREKMSAKRPCLRGRYPHWTSSVMDAAAAKGHLDVVKWLHAYRTEGCTTAAMDKAAGNGHLKVVQWLHWNRSEGATKAAIDNAATRSFHEASCSNKSMTLCCSDKTPSSFYQDQLEVLNWLHFNRSEGCTSVAMDGAAANGNFEVMRWLRKKQHAPYTSTAIDAAAAIGRLDILQWMHTQQWIRCTKAAMNDAAAGGHLSVIQWLHSNRTEGCTEKALNFAAANGHLHVVRWLLAYRSEGDIYSAMEHAIVCRQFEVMWYLDAQRIDHTPSLRQMRARLGNRDLYALTHAMT